MKGAVDRPGPQAALPDFSNVDRRIALSFGGLILTLMILVLLAGGLYLNNLMEQEQNRLTGLVTRVLANSVSRIAHSGKYHTRLLLQEIQTQQPQLRYLQISDRNGIIVAHSDSHRNDLPLSAPDKAIAERLLQQGGQHVQLLRQEQRRLREIALPYRGGYNNQVLGVIWLGISDDSRIQALHNGLILISMVVLFLLGIGVYLTRRISAHIAAPIKYLATQQAATLRAIPDLLMELDYQGRLLHLSCRNDNFLMATPEELIGTNITDRMPGAAASQVLKAVREALINGASSDFEIRLPFHGSERWFELSAARRLNPDGGSATVILLARENTERHQAQEETRNITRLYRLLTHINQLIVRQPDSPDLFQKTCEIAVAKGEFPMAWVGVLDQQGEVSVAAHTDHEPPKLYRQGPVRQVARSGEILIINDLSQRQPLADECRDALEKGYLGLAVVPLMHKQKLFGVFVLFSATTGFFDEMEVNLLKELAEDIGHALEIQHMNREQEASRGQLLLAAKVFNNSRDGILVTDPDYRIISVNQAFCELTGYQEGQLLGETPALLSSGHHDREFYENLWAALEKIGYWHGEIWDRRADGEVFPALVSIAAVYDEHRILTHYVATFTDISHIKSTEAELEYLAHHDHLTGLPNRLLLGHRLEYLLQQAERSGNSVALLLIDLDRFKNINDSFGHPTGDLVLQAVAKRLQKMLRSADSLCRLGGDEFTVLMEGVERPEHVGHLAEKLIQILAEPLLLPNGQQLHVGASIGISLFPEQASSQEGLLQQADVALYQAKDQGRGCFRFFSADMTQAVRTRLEMEARLRQAIDSGEMQLFYQPQWDMRSGRIYGAEALVRWFPRDGEMIPPDRFIPLAEETGLIKPLGDWVLQTACRQGRRWRDAGLPPLIIAVNVSPRQFREEQLDDKVRQVLAESGFPGDHLELELTESALMEDHERLSHTLASLRQQGIRLAIDDFGTGYSSLAYLKRFPLDVLKIDKSFVDDIPNSADDTAITNTIIAMALALRYTVIAEGVETEQQLQFLKERGCNFYQGYLKSPALPAERFVALLHNEAEKHDYPDSH